MNKEPVLTVTVVVAAISSLLALAAAFGLDLSQERRDLIISAVIALWPILLVMAGIIRQAVYSPATVKTEVRAAYAKGQAGESAPKLAA